MGVVYRARQPRLDRLVAVKCLRPEAGGDAAVESFMAEARITGHLAHPNIVPVIDLGMSSSGETYLAMKLVGGRSWQEILGSDDNDSVFMDLESDDLAGSAPDAPPRTGAELEPHLDIFLAVCNAIAFAHSRGFLHRDIKPANVMVGEFGEVLVMDWGLAVDIGTESAADRPIAVHKSEVDQPWGTPCYLAPEMAAGRGDAFGPWTDVFLLGATLHEVVMRSPPHRGDDIAAVLRAARSPEPPSYPPAVPEGLQKVLRRAMAVDPRDRFQDVPSLRDALRAFREHRESTRLSDSARVMVEEARAVDATGAEGARTRAYSLFGAAIAGFEQALLLWPENEAASRGARDTRIAFARSALAAGDLALARAELASLDDAESRDLRAAVTIQEDARVKAGRTARRLRRGIAAAVLLVVVALGFVAIRWDDIQRGRAEAERGRIEALLEQGFYELGEGSNDRARAAFERIMATSAVKPHEAVAGLFLTHVRAGDSGRARDLLDDHAPDRLDPRFGWLHATLLRNEMRDAEADELEAELSAPTDQLGWFILCARALQEGHRLEAIGMKGDAAAREGAARAYRGALDAITRAMLYAESQRSFYVFERAHAAAHARNETAVRECVDVMLGRFSDSPQAWFWAGFAHERLGGREAETTRCYREAARREPSSSRFAFCLGTSLMQSDPGEARGHLLHALDIEPENAETNCNLGHVQISLGEFESGLAYLRKGHEFGQRRGETWGYPSADWIAEAERLVSIADHDMAAMARGEMKLPALDPLAVAELERVARLRRSGSLLTEAWQRHLASPRPDTTPDEFVFAAGAALIAGAAEDEDAVNPDLRGHRDRAADWLEEAMRRSRLAARLNVYPPAILARNIRSHLDSERLDPIREGEALDRLPEPERLRWRRLWTEARALVSDLER